ncbi:hypothetical protein MGG_17891 [Pyricularia oryzae 70-15]|uniref:Uncharacterized protein n=4 Tax=Pyricularia oryzae TaxID=318829 RepID=G5EHB4_PYRO7
MWAPFKSWIALYADGGDTRSCFLALEMSDSKGVAEGDLIGPSPRPGKDESRHPL